MNIRREILELNDELIRIRRDLHMHPELGFEEFRTADIIDARLTELGLQTRRLAKTGVVAVLEGSAGATGGTEGGPTGGTAGPTLMLRADIDALPVQEENDVPYKSLNDGIMHACGHDAHAAMLLGTAKLLRRRGLSRGRVKLLFQPAEEGPGGAKAMIDEGVMKDPHVDYAIGCHVWPDIPEGTIGVRPGPLMAAMDRFDLKIIGKGGHGAMPHQCVDALEVGCQVVNALQRVVSRQINPISPAVVTVGSFHAGDAFNVIPGKAEMCGTARTFDRAVWERLPQQMERIVRGVCESMGASYELDYAHGYPPLINDGDVARVVRKCAESAVGKERVVEPEPTMGGEDMALFLEKAKGCFFFLGIGREGCAPLHNAGFDFNEKALSSGVETYCRVARELLR